MRPKFLVRLLCFQSPFKWKMNRLSLSSARLLLRVNHGHLGVRVSEPANPSILSPREICLPDIEALALFTLLEMPSNRLFYVDTHR